MRSGPGSRDPPFPPRQPGGMADALPGAMLDLLFVVATVAFFALAWAYVRFCHRLAGAP